MAKTVLVDYGCHSFTYRLAAHLGDLGFPIRYFANGSLESPNQRSLAEWIQTRPHVVRAIECRKPYGKLNLHGRLRGELEWGKLCTQALEEENPSAIVLSTVPLAAVARIQRWAQSRRVPIIYWLQDLQGRAIHDLLGRKFGLPGRVLGSFAYLWEQHILEQSRMVITIAEGHERELPLSVRQNQNYALLENWANIEEFPQFPVDNDWSGCYGLAKTQNVIYSGTLGLKHELSMFLTLASSFRDRSDVRIVVVSSGQAADSVRAQAARLSLSNLLVLPFQHYTDVPKVLASAAVLIAPLEASAGSFCVPSKVLSYFCAGRPAVIAIDADNPAARTIRRVGAGTVVKPGDSAGFVKAVSDFLADSPARHSAGVRARAYAEQTFSRDTVAARFLEILSASNVSLGSKLQYADALLANSLSSGV
jgi:glycosyltransferase involved in cell wall biosynthesis